MAPQDNEVVLDEEQAFAQLAMEEKCERGKCKEMPSTMKLTIRAAYGSAFLEETDNNKRSAVERIKRAVCHAQARYCHSSSLGTKIQGGPCGPCGRGTYYVDDVELVVTIWYEEPLLWWNSKYHLNQCIDTLISTKSTWSETTRTTMHSCR